MCSSHVRTAPMAQRARSTNVRTTHHAKMMETKTCGKSNRWLGHEGLIIISQDRLFLKLYFFANICLVVILNLTSCILIVSDFVKIVFLTFFSRKLYFFVNIADSEFIPTQKLYFILYLLLRKFRQNRAK